MSRKSIAALSIAILGLSSVSAFAGESSSFYVGADYGQMNVKDSEPFSKAKNAALTFGYKLTDNWSVEGQISNTITDATFSATESGDFTSQLRAELMNNGYTSAQAVAAVKSASVAATAKANASFDSYAVYGVYKTSGQFYGKVKAGIASVKGSVDIKTKGTFTVIDSTNKSTTYDASELGIDMSGYAGSGSDTETKFSVGVGAGYKFNEKAAVELEYTALTQDVKYLSLGIRYAF